MVGFPETYIDPNFVYSVINSFMGKINKNYLAPNVWLHIVAQSIKNRYCRGHRLGSC